MKTLIQKLVEASGPSGAESSLRDLIRAEIEPLSAEVRVDALGNLIARVGERSAKGLRVMLSAHMDEIGVIVTHVDEKGFVRFSTLGGVYPRNCVGSRVQFMNGTRGVISHEKLDAPDKVATIDQLFIDVGATSRKDCPLRVGDVAVFERPFIDLGARLVAKAMDDRVGVAILIEAMRQLKQTPHEIYFVFSTQEEVGIRGAATAAYGLDPELGIAIDVTATGDTPKGLKMDVALGAGPAIKVRDSGMLADPRVVDWMVKTAEGAKIPYQLEILEGGTTDARSIQLSRAGVPSGCISLPCRYVHSPSEMIDWNDVQNSLRLLVALLSKPVDLA